MKSNLNSETDHGAIDAILADEGDLMPSSGFLAATMERVREEAAMPKPIPFPWLRALPGIVLAISVVVWCGFELEHSGLANAGEVKFAQIHVASMNVHALEPVGWVLSALALSMLSWLLSRRLTGRSGLL